MSKTRTTNTQMLIQSLDRAMIENLKVYRNGSVGKEQNFIVVNHKSVDAYQVKVKNGEITKCTCPNHHWRKAICKHMLKVAMINDMDIKQLNS